MKAKNAIVQTAAFDRLCAASEILPLTEEAIVEAAEVYADLASTPLDLFEVAEATPGEGLALL